MAKNRLKNVRSVIGRLAPIVAATRRDATGHSRTAEPWRTWYSLKRWKELRLRVFVRDLFTCQRRECGKVEPVTSLLVADHRRPHKGDPALFWSEGNVQTLCKACHDSAKQAEERRRF